MSDDLKKLLAALAELADGNNGHGCTCGGCCDCTTIRSFEQTAARANDESAFMAAESRKQFVQQQGAAWAQLLKQQAPT